MSTKLICSYFWGLDDTYNSFSSAVYDPFSLFILLLLLLYIYLIYYLVCFCMKSTDLIHIEVPDICSCNIALSQFHFVLIGLG